MKHGLTSRGRLWKKQPQGRTRTPVSEEAACDCGKRAYRSKHDAELAARLAHDREHEPMHAYHCPDGLGRWHIGHQNRRRRP